MIDPYDIYMIMDEYLTVRQLAQKLCYSEIYVRVLIRKGFIQAFKLGNGPKAQFRILKSEVERLRDIGFERTLEALKKRIEEKEKENGKELGVTR